MFLTRGLALWLLLAAFDAQAVSIAGHEFAERINVPGVGNNLRLSGAATLDRNFVPFYAAALYLPASVRTLEQLQSGLSPYRVTLVWQIPELDEGRVDDYWRKAFAEAAGSSRLGRIKSNVERFVEVFGAARHGQVILFDYIPDAGMRIFVDDKPAGQLAGVEFNTVLLSIWLGDKAPRDFRTALTAGLTPN
ncbi:chalcone isomerase family protein [Tahibacter caeni]|uniref:chalcone isomerase family protein n=1 Tax=Tahibacter caeni TaxID=1453545 RepID=UPI0021485E4B|nr:chalcone isomerase family protein [Tahibacter caeni]